MAESAAEHNIKQYMTDVLGPLVDEFVEVCLKECPPDPRAAMAEFAAEECQKLVTEDLLGKGFSLRQLLKFCQQKEITQDMTTEDVARKFVIPETASATCCYMDSHFMQKLGGRQKAMKLVSHAWKCKFMNTVLNTLLNACGHDKQWLIDEEKAREGGRHPCRDYICQP